MILTYVQPELAKKRTIHGLWEAKRSKPLRGKLGFVCQNGVDLCQNIIGQFRQCIKRFQGALQLLGTRCTSNGRRHVRIFQHPGERKGSLVNADLVGNGLSVYSISSQCTGSTGGRHYRTFTGAAQAGLAHLQLLHLFDLGLPGLVASFLSDGLDVGVIAAS